MVRRSGGADSGLTAMADPRLGKSWRKEEGRIGKLAARIRSEIEEELFEDPPGAGGAEAGAEEPLQASKEDDEPPPAERGEDDPDPDGSRVFLAGDDERVPQSPKTAQSPDVFYPWGNLEVKKVVDDGPVLSKSFFEREQERLEQERELEERRARGELDEKKATIFDKLKKV